MQALEEAYELYDLKKHDRDSRQERLKQLEDNRKAIAEIEKIIENQNGSWKDFESFCRPAAWIYHGKIWEQPGT